MSGIETMMWGFAAVWVAVGFGALGGFLGGYTVAERRSRTRYDDIDRLVHTMMRLLNEIDRRHAND